MKRTAYVHANILPGIPGEDSPREGMLLTEGDEIEKITERQTVPEGTDVVDLHGAYLLPGLVNLHVHLPGAGDPDLQVKDTGGMMKVIRDANHDERARDQILKVCAVNAQAALASGVTTIRTVGGVSCCDSMLRDAIKAGRVTGPRMQVCDMAVSVPKGHMTGIVATSARSTEEALAQLEEILKGRPDWVKLMITGGVLDAEKPGEPGVLRMEPQMIRALCERAHAAGLKVCAHTESTEGIRAALRNGVDCIEHGAEPDEEVMDLFQKTGAVLVSTIMPASPYRLFPQSETHFPDMDCLNGSTVMQGIIDCTKACLDAGIPVGHGTDSGCPYITHYDYWRELAMFHAYCGVSCEEALISGTLGNAKILGLDDRIGTLETGKLADMIVTKDNPLEDLAALKNPEKVILGGKEVTGLKAQHFPRVDRLFDEAMQHLN